MLYTAAAGLLSSSLRAGGGVPIVDVLYCALLALASLPTAGYICFLIARSNKPHLMHWSTQTDFHMASSLALSSFSLLIYTLASLPSSPLSPDSVSISTCAPFLDSVVNALSSEWWMCWIFILVQACGMGCIGILVLAALTAYFNSIRLINALPLDIIEDPESPGFWRGVNVADVDWEEERFIVI
ncbi:hypothetical protein CVT24_011741 [Panaeolus cyanescens]|uniref:Uncharacterized protein n=1 Tax=Panaeolus cyanescens TaxID=181874 RepID=A0A409YNF8_9AGAR|nr:hypothetical protein CVT24_011741 [Panaeolus cyanescens]